jgi:hypothetical protein
MRPGIPAVSPLWRSLWAVCGAEDAQIHMLWGALCQCADFQVRSFRFAMIVAEANLVQRPGTEAIDAFLTTIWTPTRCVDMLERLFHSALLTRRQCNDAIELLLSQMSKCSDSRT